MGFLTPSILLLGAGLLAAILATYLLRPRRPRRRVSSTFLWLAALHDLEAHRPWRRVPPTLLLLLQLAATAAMVGAVARPFIMTPQSTGPFTIVLLDGSASMQATDVAPSRFEDARRNVSQMIDSLEPGQQLAIVALDAQPHVIAPSSSDPSELKRELNLAQPTAQPANFPAALSVAASLAENNADAQIVVIADGSLDHAQIPSSFTIPMRYVGIGTSAPANLAVAGLGTRVANGRLSALARVVNYGPRPASATLILKVDGSHFDSHTLTIEAHGAATQQWDDLPASAHTLEARLDQPDSLALDDAAWAVLGGDRPTRVLLVSDGNVFVEHALGLRSGTQVTRVSRDSYSPQGLSQAYDLIVLDGFVPPVLPDGSSVLLLHPPTNNGLLTAGSDVPISTVAATRSDDPLLADVPLGSVHVSQARRLTAPVWADTVLSSPETPLLLVGEHAGRRLGILGFDIHQSDLPLQPGFPVLMQHLLDWLVPTASTATPVVEVGDAVSLVPLPETVSLNVVTPDGARFPVAPPFPPPAFHGTARPGLYEVIQRDAAGRETTSAFAVNFVNATESQLQPGLDTGAPSVGPRREPLKAPHEFWEAFAVVGLALLALELVLAWWQFAAATLRARISLGLRAAMGLLLVLALVGVRLPQMVDRQATVFVADVSDSARPALPSMADFISQAAAARHPDDAYAVVTTARGAALEQPLTTIPPGASLSISPGQPTDGTDLAAGLRLAADLLPSGYRPRLVLLSDGQETTGDAVVEARRLHARGVQVDVVSELPTSGPEVLLDGVATPATVTEGDRFNIGVRVVSNVATDATVRVYVNDQPLAEQPVSLTPGAANLAFSAQAPQSGLLDVRATVEAAQDTLTQNNEARGVVEVQGPPRVMVVEQRPGEGDTIVSTLTSTQMRVERASVTDLPDQLDALGSYAAVVLADVSADSLSDAQQTMLRAYVRDLGRGLLAIGGDSSFGQGDYINTPLDDTLPVRSSVRAHRDQGRVALLLVIDTSGSMADDVYHEGTTKIDMAKQAALLSAQQLSPRDQIGILTFDSNQHWILPLSPLLGMPPNTIQSRLAPLVADGGTEIFGALSAAFDAINNSDARYKHVILMTDGMSCCGGDYAGLEDRMRAANITLSTIAIGGDADTNLLSQLAKQGDGRYYFADHARDIPQLTTRETDLATRGPLVEGTVIPRPVGASPDAVVAGLSSGGFPPLGGYLVTSPKDLADVLLVSDAADPLLARWQFGLGRAVAWTSDLRGRWSQDWLGWPGTAQLFSSMVSWTIAPAHGALRLSLRSDQTTGYITVEDSSAVTPPGEAGPIHAHVAGPSGAAKELDLSPTGPGEYAGAFSLDGPGTYIARVQAPDGGSTEAGLPVSYSPEYRQVTPDTGRMQQIALAGGGRVLYSPADAFGNDLPPVTTPVPLQRLLVLIAAILLPIEVALRRIRLSPRDLLDWLRRPRGLDVGVGLPRWAPEVPTQSPSWMPGQWKTRTPPPPVAWPRRAEPSLRSAVTPGLAREANEAAPDADEEDALSAATRWLAARRGTSGDRG